MEQFIQDWGYIALFILIWWWFLALVIAAAFSFDGTLNIYVTIAVAAFSNIVGSQFYFLYAKRIKYLLKDMMNNHKRKSCICSTTFLKIWFVIIIQNIFMELKL